MPKLGLFGCRVLVDKITPLAEFDGSVVVERTVGEVVARYYRAGELSRWCEERKRGWNYYAKELRITGATNRPPTCIGCTSPGDLRAADPDGRALPDEELNAAAAEGARLARRIRSRSAATRH